MFSCISCKQQLAICNVKFVWRKSNFEKNLRTYIVLNVMKLNEMLNNSRAALWSAKRKMVAVIIFRHFWARPHIQCQLMHDINNPSSFLLLLNDSVVSIDWITNFGTFSTARKVCPIRRNNWNLNYARLMFVLAPNHLICFVYAVVNAFSTKFITNYGFFTTFWYALNDTRLTCTHFKMIACKCSSMRLSLWCQSICHWANYTRIKEKGYTTQGNEKKKKKNKLEKLRFSIFFHRHTHTRTHRISSYRHC